MKLVVKIYNVYFYRAMPRK